MLKDVQSILDFIRPYALSAMKGAGKGASALVGGYPGLMTTMAPSIGHKLYGLSQRGLNAMAAHGLDPLVIGSAMSGAAPYSSGYTAPNKFDEAFGSFNPSASQTMNGPLQTYAKKQAAGGLPPSAQPTSFVPTPTPRPQPMQPPLSLAPPNPGPTAPQAQPPYGFADAPGYMGTGSNSIGNHFNIFGPQSSSPSPQPSIDQSMLNSQMGTPAPTGLFGLFGGQNGANNTSLAQSILKMFGG